MSQALIDAIATQEQRLFLDRFDEDTAYEIGCALRARAQAIQAPVSI